MTASTDSAKQACLDSALFGHVLRMLQSAAFQASASAPAQSHSPTNLAHGSLHASLHFNKDRYCMLHIYSNLYRHARNHDFQVFLVQTFDTYHSYLSHPVTFRCSLNKMPYLNPPGAALCVWELAMCKHDLSKSSCLKQCTQTKYPQANMHLRIKLSKNGPLSKLPNSLSKSIQVSSICTLRLLLHACAFLYIMYSIYSCIHVNAQWDQGQGKERCQPWKSRIS